MSVYEHPAIRKKFHVTYLPMRDLYASALEKEDVFVFQRSQYAMKSVTLLTRYLNKSGKTIIFDMDDYNIDIPRYSTVPHRSGKSRKKTFIGNLGRTHCVTVSTSFLEKLVKRYNPRTLVLENRLFIDSPKGLSPSRNEKVNLLVTSSDNLKTVKFKDEFLRVLRDIKKAYSGRVQIIFQGRFHNVDLHAPFIDETHPLMDYKRYYEFLKNRDIHIGLVPLGGEEEPDLLDFNSCKSNIKFQEFATMGIAGIYSDVEPYKSISAPNEGIIVRNTYEDWTAAIVTLMENENLRRRIVRDSWKRWKKDNSHKNGHSKLVDFLEKIPASRQGTIRLGHPSLRLWCIRLMFRWETFRDRLIYLYILFTSGKYAEIYSRIKNRFFRKEYYQTEDIRLSNR
jgi:hypothetical protein